MFILEVSKKCNYKAREENSLERILGTANCLVFSKRNTIAKARRQLYSADFLNKQQTASARFQSLKSGLFD